MALSTIPNILQRVEAGEAVFHWTPITLSHPDPEDPRKLRIWVMPDAMKLPGKNGRLIRFCVSARQLQEIADRVGGILHTEKTQDERHKAATTVIRPVINNGRGKYVADMTDDVVSAMVDERIKMSGGSVQNVGGVCHRGCVSTVCAGIISSVGKPWIVHEYMSPEHWRRYGDATAHNCGWHDPEAPSVSLGGLRLWQPPSRPDSPFIHNDVHADPAQIVDLVYAQSQLIDGDGNDHDVPTSYVYQDADLSAFVSYSGPLPVVRQPSVPRSYEGELVLPRLGG